MRLARWAVLVVGTLLASCTTTLARMVFTDGSQDEEQWACRRRGADLQCVNLMTFLYYWELRRATDPVVDAGTLDELNRTPHGGTL